MVNQPDPDMEGVTMPSGRLVLPEPPEQGQYAQTATAPIRQDRSIRHQVPPVHHSLLNRTTPTGSKDPAFMILWIAILLVVIACITLVVFAATMFFGPGSGPNQQGTLAPVATLTVSASQPTSTPTTQPTPTPTIQAQPTTNAPAPLSLQIVSIPNNVKNNSKVNVQVTTSQPGISVKLQVTYGSGAVPASYTSGSHTTANDGSVTIPWTVRIMAFHKEIQATVIAVTTDQQGNEVVSLPSTVLIRMG